MTKPVRDIDPAELRALIGYTVTARTYPSAEATEPNGTLTGTLAAVAVGPIATVVVLEGLDPSPVGVDYPFTLTWEKTVTFREVDTTGEK